jgi:hypothetical protein
MSVLRGTLAFRIAGPQAKPAAAVFKNSRRLIFCMLISHSRSYLRQR